MTDVDHTKEPRLSGYRLASLGLIAVAIFCVFSGYNWLARRSHARAHLELVQKWVLVSSAEVIEAHKAYDHAHQRVVNYFGGAVVCVVASGLSMMDYRRRRRVAARRDAEAQRALLPPRPPPLPTDEQREAFDALESLAREHEESDFDPS